MFFSQPEAGKEPEAGNETPNLSSDIYEITIEEYFEVYIEPITNNLLARMREAGDQMVLLENLLYNVQKFDKPAYIELINTLKNYTSEPQKLARFLRGYFNVMNANLNEHDSLIVHLKKCNPDITLGV